MSPSECYDRVCADVAKSAVCAGRSIAVRPRSSTSKNITGYSIGYSDRPEERTGMPTKTGRREKGTGSIAQRSSDGMWIASITLPSHGSKRRRKVVARKKYEDAVKALREMRRDLDKAGDLATSSPTLAVWLDTWLTRVAAKRLKPRTLTTYQGYIERIIVPAIGKARLDKLTPTHVHTLHDSAEKHGLSSTSSLQVHAILRVALRDAMREGKVTTNVADR